MVRPKTMAVMAFGFGVVADAMVFRGSEQPVMLSSMARSMVPSNPWSLKYSEPLGSSYRETSCIRLRGGSDGEVSPDAETVAEEAKPLTLLDKLKQNQSLDPSDHETSFHWMLTVLLRIYLALGAPMKDKVPVLSELAESSKQEKPLTAADLARMEREALRKEQDDELEQAMMEDKLKMEEEDKIRKAKEKAAKAAKEEAQLQENLLGKYTKRIEASKKALSPEPEAGEGVITLRIRCPDGTSLTRRFNTEQKVESLYHYIDVERCTKAEKAPDANEKMLELAEFEYVLVSQMPRLVVSDKSVSLKEAGIKTSCALMVKAADAEA